MEKKQIKFLIETLEQIRDYKRLSKERYRTTLLSLEFREMLEELKKEL